jgi:hypothetical protein
VNGTKHYRATILNQPTGGDASFVQFSDPPTTQIQFSIAPFSSVSRTVFARSSNSKAAIRVEVVEIQAPTAFPTVPIDVPNGLRGLVVLNPDATTPGLTASTGTGVDPADPSKEEVYTPDVTSPDVTSANVDVGNTDSSQPDVTSPDVTSPDVTSPDVTSPDVTSPDVTSPDVTSPDVTSPDVTSPDVTSVPPATALTDTTYEAENHGNTSASFTVQTNLSKPPPQGFKIQVIVHREYPVKAPVGCNLASQNKAVVVATIPGLDAPGGSGFFDTTDPSVKNVTISVPPGGKYFITYRLFDPLRADNVDFTDSVGRKHSVDPNFDPKFDITPTVIAQAVDTQDAQTCDGECPSEGTSTTPAPYGMNLTFVTQPSDVSVNTAISPAIQVKALDNQGGAVPGLSITLTILNNPSGGTISGATATTDATGVATFPNVQMNTSGTGYTLQATSKTVTSAASSAFNVTALVGSAFDPTSDSTLGDLVSAALTVDGGNLTVEVRYTPSTFNPTKSNVAVLLDVDQNNATGQPGIDGGCSRDTAYIGSEYLLDIGSQGSTPARIYQYSYPPCNALTQVGTASITILNNGTADNGYKITVPLSLLGNDDGRLKFKVISSEQINPPAPGNTGILDVMPDEGTPAGVVTDQGPPIGLLNAPDGFGIAMQGVFQPVSWTGTYARQLWIAAGEWNRVSDANQPNTAVTQTQRQQN